MAWNRPSENVNSKRAARRSAPTPPRIKGLIAGIIVVIGAGIAAWLILGTKEAEPVGADPRAARPSVIAQTPVSAPATTTVAKVVQKDYSKLSKWDIQHLEPDETNKLTDAQISYWKCFHPWPPPVESQQPKWNKSKTSIFEEGVNNDIAFVVGIEPGTRIFVQKKFDQRFVKSFLASLKRPIIVQETDGEYEKSLKRAVNAAKIELKAAYDRGEDIAQIMNDSRDELMRLGSTKETIVRMATQEILTHPEYTAEEADTVVEAVNKLLESKGIAPINGTAISRIALHRSAFRQSKENQQ